MSTVTTVPGQGAICWSTYSSKSGNFYLIDPNTDIVTEVHIDEHLKASVIKVIHLLELRRLLPINFCCIAISARGRFCDS